MKSLLEKSPALFIFAIYLSLFNPVGGASTLSARSLPMECAAVSHFAPKIVAKRPKVERKSPVIKLDKSMRKHNRRTQNSWFRRLFLQA